MCNIGKKNKTMEDNKKQTNINEFSFFEKCLMGFAVFFATVGLFIFIISICLFNFHETYDFSKKIDSGKFSNYGSFISGAVGSLWTLVGVILFYVTLRLQRKELGLQRDELALQRDELELTRGELEGQKKQMILQNSTLRQQTFENTFFQLLRTHNEIVNSIDIRNTNIKDKNVIASGRDCFNLFYRRLEGSINDILLKNEKYTDVNQSSINDALKGYNSMFSLNESDLGHYFRNLYHIIKFIDYADVDDKGRYVSFVRAQLSSYELAMIFYNCLSIYGREKFKPLIEKYSLLKNINCELIFNEKHLNMYSNKAYGKKA
jgi:hypothetical protein